MEEKVIGILRDILEDPNINASSSQSNTEKWDSMGQLNLIVELEMEFALTFEPDEISRMTSVQKIVEVIKSK